MDKWRLAHLLRIHSAALLSLSNIFHPGTEKLSVYFLPSMPCPLCSPSPNRPPPRLGAQITTTRTTDYVQWQYFADNALRACTVCPCVGEPCDMFLSRTKRAAPSDKLRLSHKHL